MRAVFSGKTDCRPYREPYLVPLMLANELNGQRAQLEAAIDTGFDGSLMVEQETFSGLGLGLAERPESQFPVYGTLAGPAVFRSSRGRISLAGKELLAEIITPVHGRGKNLIGRRVLSSFTTLIHTSETYCLGEADVE